MMKQFHLKIIIALLALVILSTSVFPLIYGNESDGGFGDDGRKTATTIRLHVIQGAGYFLDAYSDTLKFLERIELAELNGIDYPALQLLVNNALTNMQQAQQTYTDLTTEADVTPYNSIVIAKLEQFDFDTFQETNQLDPAIFKDVEFYLKKGDIRGVYHRFLSDSGQMVDTLTQVKQAVDAQTIPIESLLWELNQSASRSLMFGQYVARVFYEIK